MLCVNSLGLVGFKEEENDRRSRQQDARLGPMSRILGPSIAEALSKCGPEAIDSLIQGFLRSPQQRAWRTYAAAVVTGMATTILHDEIPALCHVASRSPTKW
jgi:hypothetical protein